MFAVGEELVENGNFSGGTSGWYLGQWGGSSSGFVASGHYIVYVTSKGSDWWNVQFQQGGIPLEQGKTYTLSFDAWKGPQNTGTQKVQINVGEDGGDYTGYSHLPNGEFSLTTAATHYSFTFNMNEPSDAAARIEFNCGLYTGTYHFDNVSLVEVAMDEAHLAASPSGINFGTAAPGETVSEFISLTNNGTLPVTVNSISTASTAFTTDFSAPVIISAGGSAEVEVTFSPSTAGGYNASLSIASDAADNPLISIPLTGESAMTGLVVDDAPLLFNALTTENASSELILANNSTAAIQITIATSVSWLSATPLTGSVAANGEKAISVVADAAALPSGTYSAQLTITHNAGNIPSPVTIPVSFTVTAGYQPESPYILNPAMNIDFVRGIADFRAKGRDDAHGGFYTDLNRDGTPTNQNIKSMCAQSRVAYAFVRAFMLTGDETYLEHARHALAFLYSHAFNNGWYFVTDINGGYMPHWGHNDWWAFQQHYAMVGITAMVEATGGNIAWGDGAGTDASWLSTGLSNLNTHLWDGRTQYKGYYNHASTNWSNRWEKGFTPTVDAITTHAALLNLMFDDPAYEDRLMDLADNIIDHLAGSMSISALGWPEVYGSEWNVDSGVTTTDVGHVYKVAWVLQRIFLRHPERVELSEAAQEMMWDMWENGGYDHVNGGPFSQFQWNTGQISNRNKDHWMLEQGVTSGLINYYVADNQTDKDMYLQVADESMQFYMTYQVDHTYGDIFDKISDDGSSIVQVMKGGLFNGGYHAVELGYYTYLYSSLYYHDTPVSLYYKYPSASAEQNIRLTPVAIEDELLKILSVERNGTPYSSYDSDTRILTLPAGTGGVFKVTFGRQAVCGDSICSSGETCSSCAADCGACEFCGDGICTMGETCDSCSVDCGACEFCGDGICNSSETCDSCSEDCGTCEFCGDGVCNGEETCGSCAADCGACEFCGDGVCNNGETCSSCAADCGACEFCGDGACNNGESCETCADDCGECPVNHCTCPNGCDALANVFSPFTKDGAGNTCYFLTNMNNFINNWNNIEVNVNGVDITNAYMGNWNYPSKQDGGYYLYYHGNYPWSHLEVR